MDEVIRLLREQTVLCSRLTELFAELKEVIKKNSTETGAVVQKIEPLLRDLVNNEKSSREFLKGRKVETFAAFIESCEYNIQRELSERLLQKSFDLQKQLKQQTEEVGKLLKSGMAYVDFNLNILSRTTTSNIYGATSETKSSGGRRIFDANV